MSPSQSASDSPIADHPSGGDHAQGPPRKKMRKGTKSCLECRRRKIKCTFEPGRTAICNECYARGSTCIDQEHGDINSYTQQTAEQSTYSLRERVTQLEGLVRQVLHRLPEGQNGESTASPDRSQVDAQAAEVLKSLKTGTAPTIETTEESIYLPTGFRDEAPALTLFDNAVISRKDSVPAMSRAQYNKSKTVIAALNHLLPSPHDLEIILESSHEWWTIWRKMFPDITDRRCETMRQSVSHSLRSDKPAEIAKIMLCIAISIHQMPDGFDWNRLQLKESRTQLIEKYVSTVNRLIVSDDEIAATVEGIECMALEAKYQVNMGRPRRAWLLYTRAISFAQLLGIHRLANHPNKANNEFKRQVGIWTHLVMGDRFMSLILGLPYSVPDAFCLPYITTSASPSPNVPQPGNDGEAYMKKMVAIASRLVDRNQSVIPLAYSATLSLDQQLDDLSSAQDPSWWTVDMIPGQSTEDHFDRLQAQFLHHQTKVLLHMPFMLRPHNASDKRYQYSHTQALEGARGMIRYYEALRTNQSVGPYICKLIDFQSFTAAMLLVLNLCGYSAQHRQHSSNSASDLDQDQRDSELIDRTIDLLKGAEKEVGGVVAAQCAQALEMIAKVRHMTPEMAKMCSQEEMERHTCQVSIPYFGTITIGAGKQFVPIKPGTYTKLGEGPARPRSQPPGTAPSMNSINPHTGLPTPPSLASTTSTQPSPIVANIEHSSAAARGTGYAGTDYIAPGLGQPWPEDDPFVTFDPMMAFPPGMGGPMDFPTSDSSGGSSGFTPQAYSQTPEQMAGFGTASTTTSGGYPFPTGGFPFSTGGFGGSTDLDQGWNWFGVEAPVV
jgi:hypothetical protein